MNARWKVFLAAQGAYFDGTRVSGFARPHDESGTASNTVLADLSHEGLIAVTGGDARNFLQGQLSTDLQELAPERGQLSSWSNAKGRVVTLFRVFQRDEVIHLALPQPLLAPVMQRLSMYVLRSKALLTDAGDAFVRFGIAGTGAEELLHQAGLTPPPGVNEQTHKDETWLMRLQGQMPRYAVHGPAEALIPLWQALQAKDARPAGEDYWALLKILAGEPTVYPATSEHFVAQMLGLEELGAINFRKGCYTGQEVIARAHYRGGVKRHLVHARCQTPEPVSPGTAVKLRGQNQTVAEIVDARRDIKGETRMLVVIQDEHRASPLALSGKEDVTLDE